MWKFRKLRQRSTTSNTGVWRIDVSCRNQCASRLIHGWENVEVETAAVGEVNVRTILVTGAAGFIGFHLVKRLLATGQVVIGIDNLNGYYDVTLKQERLSQLLSNAKFRFYKCDIADGAALNQLFEEWRPQIVVNLAAQAGVRYSLQNPSVYIQSNIVGFGHVLEGCRNHGVEHLVFASSSSVYGANTKMPFSVHDNVDHPISLYAASKKANELMAHSYAHTYQLPVTGLRFFTVYGPWGRPDMAPFVFTKAILDERPIDVFNCGKMKRDFTYVDDIVEGVVRVMEQPSSSNESWNGCNPDPGSSRAPYRIYNIGNNTPVELMRFIGLLEDCLNKKAHKNLLPAQPGEVLVTCADVDDLMRDTGFKPNTPIEVGIRRFVDWYRSYYKV